MKIFGYTIVKTRKLDNLVTSKRRYSQLTELIGWMGEFDIVMEMRKGFSEHIASDAYIIDCSRIRRRMRSISSKKENTNG